MFRTPIAVDAGTWPARAAQALLEVGRGGGEIDGERLDLAIFHHRMHSISIIIL